MKIYCHYESVREKKLDTVNPMDQDFQYRVHIQHNDTKVQIV